MQKAVIYGCGKVGKFVYEHCRYRYDILFFVDKNADVIKCYDTVPVYFPQKLEEYPEVKILIAVYDYHDVLNDIKRLDIFNKNIEIYNLNFEPVYSKGVAEALEERTINLGEWLQKNESQSCKELTFIPGGSHILDYTFLKLVAMKSGSKEYLEIGTYIGESINILTDCCEKLYSVTLPVESARRQFKPSWRTSFIGRLTTNKKIISYYTDSKQFDFSKHAETVDLYFIDGDHSYNGVYHDTKNIFMNKKEDAIVVWHDFKYTNAEYKEAVIHAVYDALGEDMFQNVYVTDNNACGIFIPPHRMNEFGFVMRDYKNEENIPLYTYDVTLNCKKSRF